MIDFLEAQQTVTRHLDKLYLTAAEQPTVLPYGFDTGDAWAPMVDWDGVMGVFVWLVDKQTGDLTPKSFPEFLDMPDPTQVGPWPEDNT